jgi:Lon protease-like protein
MAAAMISVHQTTAFLSTPSFFAKPLTLTRRSVLTTAFEWLSEEHYDDNAYRGVSWIDPALRVPTVTSPTRNENIDDSSLTSLMPLYPLPATYLPVQGTNFTLNNVEPRNLQMALDLMDDDDSNDSTGKGSRCFCAVLRATDTGRIASVGTVLKILDIAKQERDDQLIRIVVTCQAQEAVEICSIENPKAASYEQRLRRSPEYLKARVRPLQPQTQVDESSIDARILSQLVEDFGLVKTMYKLGVGSHKMPPQALVKIADALPTWTTSDFESGDQAFWNAAQVWQSLCYTVLHGRQMMLSTDRNELMVAAASQKGGPLKLPIHMEELNPAARRRIETMEVRAQEEFFDLGLDPCLDFQAMISLASRAERIQLLSQLVSRERRRLEMVAQQIKQIETIETNEPEEPPKGAWFNDDAW